MKRTILWVIICNLFFLLITPAHSQTRNFTFHADMGPDDVQNVAVQIRNVLANILPENRPMLSVETIEGFLAVPFRINEVPFGSSCPSPGVHTEALENFDVDLSFMNAPGSAQDTLLVGLLNFNQAHLGEHTYGYQGREMMSTNVLPYSMFGNHILVIGNACNAQNSSLIPKLMGKMDVIIIEKNLLK